MSKIVDKTGIRKGTSEYNSWIAMRQRCHYKKSKSYANYGARGITVCERWLNSFPNFLADMGNKPEGFTLERLENDKGYFPENCAWRSRTDQMNNNRRTIKVTYKGETLSIEQWCQKLGLPSGTIRARYHSGEYTTEQLLETPIKESKFKMKALRILIPLLLLATLSHAQIYKASKVWIEKEVKIKDGDKFEWIVDSDHANDTAMFVVPADPTKKYQATTVFKEIKDPVPVPDTIIEIFEPNRITAVNRTTYTGSNKPGISDGSFSVVTNVAALSSSSLTFTGVKVQVFTERYLGHGIIDVFVDNVKSGTYNLGIPPFDTDFSKNKPTFSKKLTPGTHTIRVQSTTGQNIVDFFRTYSLKR